jgi:hypothetical protein
MLISYIHEAMRLAKYEILEDHTTMGKFPAFREFGQMQIRWMPAARNCKVCWKIGL